MNFNSLHNFTIFKLSPPPPYMYILYLRYIGLYKESIFSTRVLIILFGVLLCAETQV